MKWQGHSDRYHCKLLPPCAQLKISYSVHQNLNVKANNDRSFDFTLPAGQQPGQGPPPQAAPQVCTPL